MEIKYVAKGYKISDKFKDIIEKKLEKLEKYFNADVDVKVACTEQNDNCKLEITVNTGGVFLRSEVTSDNMFNNIDMALPKIEKQIIKSKRFYRAKFADKQVMDTLEFLDKEPEITTGKVVKKKSFELDPITVEDAQVLMEALDHNFYVFLNAETGLVSILYKRSDNNFGLIEVKN